ncbi:hypothetical protein B4073_3485 [Bacillus subtilis]|nr:hypothetical protein B4073_3485 [Bacillus subtilis]
MNRTVLLLALQRLQFELHAGGLIDRGGVIRISHKNFRHLFDGRIEDNT